MTKEQYDTIQVGDIILVRNAAWLSRMIRKFMNGYRKRQGLPKRELWSHAAMVIDVWGHKYVAEAQKEGIIVRDLKDAYGNSVDRIKVRSPKKAYTKKEKELVTKSALADVMDPTRYDYFGLLHQIFYVTTGKWIGPKGDKADRRLYCTEAVANWANKVRPNTFPKEYSINPLDVDLNKYYKDIEL